MAQAGDAVAKPSSALRSDDAPGRGPRPSLLVSFVMFLFFFGLSAYPWEGAKQAYAAAFSGAGNFLFGSLGSYRRARFMLLHPARGSHDVGIEIDNRRTQIRSEEPKPISSRWMGYVPTVFTLSLIVAAPVPWRRRAVGLVLGLVIVNAFIALRVQLSLLYLFSGTEPSPTSIFGRFLAASLNALYTVLVGSPAGAFIIPLLIAGLVCMRRDDLKRLKTSALTRRTPRQASSPC